jgi:hypothetical protein
MPAVSPARSLPISTSAAVGTGAGIYRAKRCDLNEPLSLGLLLLDRLRGYCLKEKSRLLDSPAPIVTFWV